MDSRRCCILGCILTREERKQFPPVFRFANYKRGIERFNKWIAATGDISLLRKSSEVGGREKLYDYYRVCKRYFRDEDFLPYGKLKPTAVPTLHLPGSISPSQSIDLDTNEQSPGGVLLVPSLEFRTPSPMRLQFLQELSTPRRHLLQPTLVAGKSRKKLKLNGNKKKMGMEKMGIWA